MYVIFWRRNFFDLTFKYFLAPIEDVKNKAAAIFATQVARKLNPIWEMKKLSSYKQ